MAKHLEKWLDEFVENGADPNNITEWPENAGGGSSKLPEIIARTVTNITAEDLSGVTSIGKSAFQSCTSLISIEFPDSVTSIGDFSICSCTSLTNVTIPNSVTSIGQDAFEYCKSLTSITIPNSVKSIGGSVFYGCSNLTDFNYAGTMAEWANINLDSRWHTGTTLMVVHCTDGNVSIY